MKVGLVSGSYSNKYLAVNTKRNINWWIYTDLNKIVNYAVSDEGSKYKKALLPFPGLTSIVDSAGTTIRGIFVARTVTYNRCFVVVDTTLYELGTDGTLTSRGALTLMTGTDTAFMEVNGNNQLMIAGYAASYIYDLSTDTLTAISTSSNKISSTLTATKTTGDTILTVASTANMSATDIVQVTLDSAVVDTTTISSINSSTSLTLSVALTGTATSGAVIRAYSSFPNSITHLSYSSGYFFVCSGGRVYYSALNSGFVWEAASVFTPIAMADNTLACIVWKDELYCFGSESIETYINDGSTPFVKQARTTVPIGVVAVDTIRTTESGIYFVGRTKKGQYQVYMYDGQNCTPISPLSTSWNINSPVVSPGNLNTLTTTWENQTAYTWDAWTTPWDMSDTNDPLISTTSMYADLVYTKTGTALYYLTIPNLSTTFVFDTITKEWSERQSYNPTTTAQGIYRGKRHVNFNGITLVTDALTGKIFFEDHTVITEDSQTVTRTIISGITHNEKKNLSTYELELEMTTGVGLQATPATAAYINLYVSRDGGNTYGSAISLNSGASGAYTQRARCTNLGTSRDWVFKLIQTDKADLAINEIIIHGVVGNY